MVEDNNVDMALLNVRAFSVFNIQFEPDGKQTFRSIQALGCTSSPRPSEDFWMHSLTVEDGAMGVREVEYVVVAP